MAKLQDDFSISKEESKKLLFPLMLLQAATGYAPSRDYAEQMKKTYFELNFSVAKGECVDDEIKNLAVSKNLVDRINISSAKSEAFSLQKEI